MYYTTYIHVTYAQDVRRIAIETKLYSGRRKEKSVPVHRKHCLVRERVYTERQNCDHGKIAKFKGHTLIRNIITYLMSLSRDQYCSRDQPLLLSSPAVALSAAKITHKKAKTCTTPEHRIASSR